MKVLEELKTKGVTHLKLRDGYFTAVNPYPEIDESYGVKTLNDKWCELESWILNHFKPIPLSGTLPDGVYEIGELEEVEQMNIHGQWHEYPKVMQWVEDKGYQTRIALKYANQPKWIAVDNRLRDKIRYAIATSIYSNPEGIGFNGYDDATDKIVKLIAHQTDKK